MTPLAKFQLQLARIEQLGYARCVAFSVVATPASRVASTAVGLIPSKPNGGDSDSRPSGAEALGDAARTPDSILRGRSSTVRAKRLQVHRTNRVQPPSANPFFPKWGES